MDEKTKMALSEFKAKLDLLEKQLTEGEDVLSAEWGAAFKAYRELRDAYITFGHGLADALIKKLEELKPTLKADIEKTGGWLNAFKSVAGAVGSIASLVGKANPLGWLVP